MRGFAFACLGLVPLSGCHLMKQVAHNTAYEKRLYLQDERLEHRVRKDAKDVLREVCARHPKRNFGKDFVEGFEDGYADFLTYGGPIRPPAQAPQKYRTAKYLSPEGHCMVKDYFQGFQYGSECAQATGRRQFFTHLVLTSDMPPPAPLDITVLPPPPEENAKKPVAPPPVLVPDLAPMPKTEPKVEPKAELPPQPMIPKAMPAAPVRTADPVPTPEVKPLPIVPMPVPTAPRTMAPVPQPTLPVPVVPASNPAPSIPLVPMLPTVSLMPTAPTVVPVGHTELQK